MYKRNTELEIQNNKSIKLIGSLKYTVLLEQISKKLLKCLLYIFNHSNTCQIMKEKQSQEILDKIIIENFKQGDFCFPLSFKVEDKNYNDLIEEINIKYGKNNPFSIIESAQINENLDVQIELGIDEQINNPYYSQSESTQDIQDNERYEFNEINEQDQINIKKKYINEFHKRRISEQSIESGQLNLDEIQSQEKKRNKNSSMTKSINHNPSNILLDRKLSIDSISKQEQSKVNKNQPNSNYSINNDIIEKFSKENQINEDLISVDGPCQQNNHRMNTNIDIQTNQKMNSLSKLPKKTTYKLKVAKLNKEELKHVFNLDYVVQMMDEKDQKVTNIWFDEGAVQNRIHCFRMNFNDKFQHIYGRIHLHNVHMQDPKFDSYKRISINSGVAKCCSQCVNN